MTSNKGSNAYEQPLRCKNVFGPLFGVGIAKMEPTFQVEKGVTSILVMNSNAI
jgi:hypothetical protein